MISYKLDFSEAIESLRKMEADGVVTRELVNNSLKTALYELGEVALKKYRSFVEQWYREVRFDINYVIDVQQQIFSFDVIASDDVFRYVDEGTELHMIPETPKAPGDPLTFLWDGNFVSKSQVTHPGSEPAEYTREVIETLDAQLDEIIYNAVAEEVRKIQAAQQKHTQ